MDIEFIKIEFLCEKDYNNFLIGIKENKDKEMVLGIFFNYFYLIGI